MEKRKTHEILDDIFETEEASPPLAVIPVGDPNLLPAALEQTEENKDIDEIINTIKTMVKTGADAVENLAFIAKENESARGYEALAALIKTTTDSAKSVIDIRKQKKEMKILDNEIEGKTNPTTLKQVNNNVFVGSTKDFIKKLAEEDDE